MISINFLERVKGFEWLRSGLSSKEQIHVIKRLSFLISAGVPLLSALGVLNEQSKSQKLKRLLTRAMSDVSNGEPLYVSFERSGVFTLVVINMIRVGEFNGMLHENLTYIATELEKSLALRRKIISALLYPICISMGTLSIVLLLISYVFPKVIPIFQSLHVTLPFTTRILLWISTILADYGLFMALITVALAVAFVVVFKRSPPLRYHLFKFVLQLPLLGSLLRDHHMAHFCRMIGLLLKSGLPLSQSVEVTMKATSNELYRRECEGLLSEVFQGGKISTRLAHSRAFFPPLLTEMVSIGEISGNLSETLLYLSTYFEAEVEDATRAFSTSLEPMLMVGVGLVVGFVAISILNPVYEITQHIK